MPLLSLRSFFLLLSLLGLPLLSFSGLLLLLGVCLSLSLSLFSVHLLLALLGLFSLFLPEMVALGFISRQTVVRLVEGVAGHGCLKVLQQLLVLVHLKLTALLETVDASARLMAHNSFLLLSVSITVSEPLEIHPSEPLLEIETILFGLSCATVATIGLGGELKFIEIGE